MVDFLLDNTLGAWHAGKLLAANLKLAETAQSEEELREAVALPGCPWSYLRFIKSQDGKWMPAAGTFDGWPKTAKELKCLDPCMGSGHFVVAMFERLVALCMAEEKEDEAVSVATVIRDNLFALEIDPRCTQIGAFNLALAAWRRIGQRKLPAINLACSGLAPNSCEAEWLALAGDNEKLWNGMERLYRLFKDAPVLGSLINPRVLGGDLLVAEFHELQPLLEQALQREKADDAHEMAVTAQGVAKAAEILAGQFTLVATNVPYLGRGKQEESLKNFCDRTYAKAKADLATCFVQRCIEFCDRGGSTSLVTPQNWWFLSSYRKFRKGLLESHGFCVIATLGEEAWQSFGDRGPFAALLVIHKVKPTSQQEMFAIDALSKPTIEEKVGALLETEITRIAQTAQINNPDHRITVEQPGSGDLLRKNAYSYAGIQSGDYPRFGRVFCEVSKMTEEWEFQQSTMPNTVHYAGCEGIFLWEGGKGTFYDFVCEILGEKGVKAWIRGEEAHGKRGIVVSSMRYLPASLYVGRLFDNNTAVIVPENPEDLGAIWCFCSSAAFRLEVRKIDKKKNVTNATFTKVPFDLFHWQKVAAEKYPHGLPKPSSSDPTQWLFNGHPKGSDQPLHVAVARLIGYQWPRQTGSSFPDCPTLGPDGLEKLADKDGIVSFSQMRDEAPAAERMRALLAESYGSHWGHAIERKLIAATASKATSLEEWLSNDFFAQHCALFLQRPFIWHIWDGRKDGFNVLVNYHKLAGPNGDGYRTLETLTHAYLGDWITRQKDAAARGEAGADDRLAAALELQSELKKIVAGEPPYDLFIRWKPLHQQAIGWHPDINDGVRLNIRPFLGASLSRGKIGVGLLRAKPNIKWEKDRGKEPLRPKQDFPWFWKWDEESADFDGGAEFDGNRWNDCHYTTAKKHANRQAKGIK
jgi:hypothetical protein